jgi:hypothetical protein
MLCSLIRQADPAYDGEIASFWRRQRRGVAAVARQRRDYDGQLGDLLN